LSETPSYLRERVKIQSKVAEEGDPQGFILEISLGNFKAVHMVSVLRPREMQLEMENTDKFFTRETGAYSLSILGKALLHKG
jgi:hypothetical protein